MDVGAPLIADGEAAELGKPSEGALDDPAMAPELLAGFDAASGDPRRDGAGAALDPAAAMVISPGSSPGQALVGMELVRPTTRATPTARAHARHRVERGSQHHAVVAVGPAQRQAERRAPRVQMIDWSTRWRLVPGLPRSVGFGPVASPPFWLAGWRCRAPPGSSPGHRHRATAPAARDGGPPRPRPRANPAGGANRSCRYSPAPQARPSTPCPCAAPRGCPPVPHGPGGMGVHLSASGVQAAAAVRWRSKDRRDHKASCRPNALKPVLSRTQRPSRLPPASAAP